MWGRSKKFITLSAGGIGLGVVGYYLAGNRRSVISTRFDFQKCSPEILAQKDRPIPTRDEQISKLKSGQVFDLVIIGGGATGLGIALDASSRGLDVALVEKNDFCSGTSGRSTKLIHGGVRYLEKAFWNLDKAQFDLVVEALHERAHLLKISPHLSHEFPIMLPIYSWLNIPYYWAGSKVYDVLAGKEGLQRSYYLSKTMALEKFPMLRKDNLKGAMVYYDGQHNDARMGISIAMTAASQSATVCNHVEVVDIIKHNTFEKEDSSSKNLIRGVRVCDNLSGDTWEIRAKGVINATGPFTDIVRQMDNPSATPIVSPSSGVHVVLPNYYSPRDMGLLDPETSDGRLLFFLPWQDHTIAGTTDVPCEVDFDPTPTEAEIRFILHEIKNYLSDSLMVRRGDVLSAWTGIRPLVRDPTKPASGSTQGLARTHIVFQSESGLLNVAGGKWTTYRRMAQDTVDEAITLFGLNPSKKCQTEKIMLIGGHTFTPTMFIKLIQQFGLEREVAKYICENYGDKAWNIAQLARPSGKRWPTLGRRIAEGYPYTEGEVRYCVKYEYASKASDVLARRTRLAFLDAFSAMEAAPRVIDIMGEELNWSDERKKNEFEETKKFLYTMGLLRGTSEAKFNKMDIIKFHNIFEKMDSANNGYLTVEQLQSLLSNFYNESVPIVDVAALVDMVDLNQNGKVEFNEFLDIIWLGSSGKHELSKNILAVIESDTVTTERSGGGL